jgi:hypothetical protein
MEQHGATNHNMEQQDIYKIFRFRATKEIHAAIGTTIFKTVNTY